MSQSVRERMIEAAWLLIAERGLEGMSTREVLARTGAPRGSVYHHFPRGRTELIELAIDRSIRWMGGQIAAIQADSALDVVDGYFDIWRRVLIATDYRAGCATAGVVSGGFDADILDRGAAAFSASSEALAAKLHEIGMGEAEARSRATLLVAAGEGAVLLARAQRSTKPLDLVATEIGRTI